MTFLPIVGRELRVAARRWFTYWGRFSAAMLAFLIFAGMQTIFMLGGGPFNPGYYQFQVMKWFLFVIAALAGLFLTSDALSEEKREGTLGLLFLTDLRGYDVVLGKLISRSAQAFYGLLAVFPVLGLSLLNGGLTGAEFGRSTLVICNTLFLSLAAGLFISALSREAVKSLNVTLLLILVLNIGLLVTDWGLAGWNLRKYRPIFSSASPAYLLAMTGSYLPKTWWFYLGLQHLLGWVLLAFTSIFIPRAWQDKATKTGAGRQTWLYRTRFGGQTARLTRRRKLLSKNPMLWLASRDRWLHRIVWLASLASLALFIFMQVYIARHPPSYAMPMRYLMNIAQFLIRFVFLLWVALQSSRFFVEALRNGAMELILVTPATPAQIVNGQWRALRRTFLLPGLLLLAVTMASHFTQIRETLRLTNTSLAGSTSNFMAGQIISIGAGILTYITDVLAVAWFGMWQGMVSRKPSTASLKTIFIAFVLPWHALMFISGLIFIFMSIPRWHIHFPFWMPTTVVTVLSLAKDLFFILWSRKQLADRFRLQAAREIRVSRRWVAPPSSSPPPPPVLRPPALPPPIPYQTQ